MRISIPADIQAFLKEKVDSGRYHDANEAINDALRLLKQRDEAEFEALRALLKQRHNESRLGSAVPFDSKLRNQIRRRGMKRLSAMSKARS